MIAKFIICGPVVAIICFVGLIMFDAEVGAALAISWLSGTVSVVVLAIYNGFFRKPVDLAADADPQDEAQCAVNKFPTSG